MKRSPETRRLRLRRELSSAAEEWWWAISESAAPETQAARMRALANAALRLHLFEQGYRAGRGEKERR